MRPNIDNQKFKQFLLIKLFESFVKNMKDQAKEQQIHLRFLNSSNKILVTKNLFFEQFHYSLNEEEAAFLYQYFHAYYMKRKQRQLYDNQERLILLHHQNYECNLCHKAITLSNSELDHIIPWSMVGDELKNNLQMLCISCNRRKNKNIIIPFPNAILF